MTHRIKLVLDSTAIAAFALDDRPDVGETIEQVMDEGAAFALPLLCLAEAAGAVKPDGLSLLRLLAEHPHGVTVPVVDDWELLAREAQTYGTFARASVALAARSNRGAYVLTKQPDGYGELPTVAL